MAMDADEFRLSLARVGWSAQWFAAQVGYHPSTVKAWRDGNRTIPAAVASWVRKAVSWMDRNPAPERDDAA